MGGGALGAFLAPQLISNVVINWQDNWRIGWYIIALFAVVGAVIALITVRNRPSDMGQHPDGLAPQESGVTPQGTPRIIHTHRTRANWTVREAVRTPSLWLLIFATGTCLFLFQVIQSQAPFHLRDRSFSPADAGFFYSLALGFGILGRFSVAALGDRIEPRYLFACATILMLFGGILFWLVSPQSLWIAYLYPLLTGFGFGIAYTCFPTIIGNYWGPKAFPGINGIGQTFIAILQAGAAPASGFLYDLQGTYLTVLVIGCTGAAIACIAIMLCHPPRSKHKI
jgi:Na+/melibiose symporter-like transporter